MRVGSLLLLAVLATALRSDAADLEPQVRATIASARAAVAENPGTGETWGELAMVLQAHGLQNDAYGSYLEAMARAPADYRWPYLAALTDRPADAALELLAKAHALGPDDAALALTYGEALTRAGRLDQARAVYRKTGGTESSKERADLGLARIAFLEEKVEDALEILEAVRPRGSRNSDLYRLLAQARRQVGDSGRAEEAAWQARSYGTGLQTVSEVVDQMHAHGTSVSALLEHGRRLSARGEHEKARGLFQTALRFAGGGEALIDLGQVALALGETREAIEHFQAGLLEKPENADLQVGLANAWLQRGDDTAAEHALATALGRRPDHAGAHQALGQLRLRQRRYREAARHLQKALAAEPARYLATADLAEAFAGQESFDEALEARRKLAVLEPDNLPNLRSLARLEIQLADLGAAQATLRQIHELRPGELTTAFNLAMLLATSAPATEAAAAESLDLALELYRTRRHDAASADLLGIAYAANGRYGDATRFALRARELAKGDPALGAAIDDHLARYAQRQPVIEPQLR